MPTTPASLRAKILAFLVGREPTDRGAIKAYLGMEPYSVSSTLDQALKSRRIKVTKVHPQIGTAGATKLYAATPISLYSLAL